MLKDQIEKYLLDVQKPSRYIGGEVGSIMKDKNKVDVRFAFCFPDSYDVGMSHLGMKILYALKNARDNFWCERVFAPWLDFEKLMREHHIPLYGLESLEPIRDFDFIGFTLQYELSYTNVLNMLDLAGLPVYAKERTDLFPIVVAGGPCACNPEPLADFIDIFILGEGEEVNLELMDLYLSFKKKNASKTEFLLAAAQISGVYVPSLYEISYDKNGFIQQIQPRQNAPYPVTKRIIADFDKVFYPETFVVPFSEIVHDRAVVEVLRGCIRGCRFCQAGFIYRPFREKKSDTIVRETKALCESTGYEDVSLASLSTSDHSEIQKILSCLVAYAEQENISLSLPSLRVDNFSEELLEKISSIRKTGLTFAPEAGTQRLRNVINKNVSDDEIMTTCAIAFAGGYASVKLYFMMGLPTERDEDIIGIAELAQRIIDMYYAMPKRPQGKGVQVSISCATFVPKPFTPFQFEPQDTAQEIKRKQELLLSHIKTRKITVSWHKVEVSMLEAVLARGDRRLGTAIYKAWKAGCIFDSWDECFDYSKWIQAFQDAEIEPAFYANRQRAYDEILPWEHLDYYVSKEFLIREHQKAYLAQTTPHCMLQCGGCGVSQKIGGPCFE